MNKNPKTSKLSPIFLSTSALKLCSGFLSPLILAFSGSAREVASALSMLAVVIGASTLARLGSDTYHMQSLSGKNVRGYKDTILGISIVTTILVVILKYNSFGEDGQDAFIISSYACLTLGGLLSNLFKAHRHPSFSQILDQGSTIMCASIITFLLSLTELASNVSFYLLLSFSFLLLFFIYLLSLMPLSHVFSINIAEVIFSPDFKQTADYKIRLRSFLNSVLLYINSWGLVLLIDGVNPSSFFFLFYALKIGSFCLNLSATVNLGLIRLIDTSSKELILEYVKIVRQKSVRIVTFVVILALPGLLIASNYLHHSVVFSVFLIGSLCLVIQSSAVWIGPFYFLSNIIQDYSPSNYSFLLIVFLVIINRLFDFHPLTPLPFFVFASSLFPRLIAYKAVMSKY